MSIREHEAAHQDVSGVRCAACGSWFEWREAYWQKTTPGAKDPIHNETLPRAFCPNCGALVAAYDADRDLWSWVGDNAALNERASAPPSPFLLTPDDAWWRERQLPDGAVVPYERTVLDLSLVASGRREEIPHELKGAEGAYFERCMEPAFNEEEESRDWQTHPELRQVLDPLNRGDFALAEATAEALAQTFPDLDLVYGWWGSSLIERRALDQARDLLRLGLEKSNRKFSLCVKLGELEWKACSVKEAVYWWAQAVHCQETLDRCGGSGSAYLYLQYVAEVAGLLDVAAAFLARSDRIRSGQIRLEPEAADDLQGVAARGNTAGVESVLRELRTRYLLHVS